MVYLRNTFFYVYTYFVCMFKVLSIEVILCRNNM